MQEGKEKEAIAERIGRFMGWHHAPNLNYWWNDEGRSLFQVINGYHKDETEFNPAESLDQCHLIEKELIKKGLTAAYITNVALQKGYLISDQMDLLHTDALTKARAIVATIEEHEAAKSA